MGVVLFGINRNIVECKSVKSNVLSPVSSVLIETLWNVNNLSPFCFIAFRFNVLIETLWNVNYDGCAW